MHIDKVLFSFSDDYVDFWALNSKIFKTRLGIHPVGLYYGNGAPTTEYGEVIRQQYLPELPKTIQLTWAKFRHPEKEPNITWMIGDIDQIPLQRDFFVEALDAISPMAVVHLNAGGCATSCGLHQDTWRLKGPQLAGGADLPANYHIASGKLFGSIFSQGIDYNEQITRLCIERKYGLGRVYPNSQWSINDEKFFWCAEEGLSSELLFNYLQNGGDVVLKFHGDRVCRSQFSPASNDYSYNINKLKSGGYIDMHCQRPHSLYKTQTERVLQLAGMI